MCLVTRVSSPFVWSKVHTYKVTQIGKHYFNSNMLNRPGLPGAILQVAVMRHCKHSQRSQSHSVELIFAPFLGKISGSTLVPYSHTAIQLSESLKIIVVCNNSFSFRQLLIPKNYKILAFSTEVKKVSFTLP